MQKLHLVGFTTDLDGLIFSARKGSKAGSFMVHLDQQLLATIAEAERLRNGESGESGEGGDAGAQSKPSRPTSRLTPREIQARLRAGRSIPEVAAEAGVSLDWIDRFAAPIAAEQARMVERARVMTYSKQRLGQSSQPLGISVRWNLLDKGVLLTDDEFESGWSAFQVQDDIWMIRFRYTSRNKLQSAEWELDAAGKTLTSRNRPASELGYVEKGRRPRAIAIPAPRPPAAPPVQVVEAVVELEPGEAPAPTPAPMISAPTRRRRRAAAKKRAPKKTAKAKKRAPTKTAKAKKTTRARAPRKEAKAATKKARAKKTAPATKKRTAPRPTATKKKATKKRATKARAAKTTVRRATTRAPAAAANKTALARKTTRARKRLPAPPAATPVEPTPPAKSAKRSGHGAVKRSRSRPASKRAPTIAGKRAADRTPRPATPRRRPAPSRPRVQRRTTEGNGGAQRPATPTLSGPLARSLLARRLLARKAQGDGDQRERPIRLS